MDEIENSNTAGVASEILQILRCPACASGIEETAEGLACVGCRKAFPKVRNVVRFVNQQHYAGSFGFQWLKHDRTQLDAEHDHRSELDFIEKTGLRAEDLRGKLVLDVGCGMGRYAEVMSRWGARLIGIDLSAAVEAAARNLAAYPATIFQADVFSLPFAEESFDYIYSLGVLHHTPDCEQAFKCLPKLMKPGGGIAIWLYSAYNRWYRMSDLYRKVTRRMPPKLLHTLCYGAIPLYGLHKVLRIIPLVGKPASGAMRQLIPMSFNEDPQWRVLDTFDWYSPWYQSKHTYEEVFRWFETSGLEDLHVGGVPISVRGRRPNHHAASSEIPRALEVSSCAE
jgi:2-polyprenyl-3-methyl-5-hydroxy-6-metoxy-1,4-benzoquinol methylase